MSKDVSLWFARNENDEIVTIDNINKNDNKKYYCPLCGSELIPKQGNIMSWHFAHVDKTKCTIESAYHFWVKNELFKVGESFRVQTDGVVTEYRCSEIFVEQTYNTRYKNYTPDLTIITECKKRIFVEINHTNKKIVNTYIDVWLELNSPVVEIQTKDVIDKSGENLYDVLFSDGYVYKEDEKEDCLYITTIGKFKKNLNKYQKQHLKLKQLDWFWSDLVAYNSGVIDMSRLMDSIYSLDSDFLNVVDSIINQSKCCNIYEDIKVLQQDEIRKAVLPKAMESSEYKFLKIRKPSVLRIINSNMSYGIPTLRKSIFESTIESTYKSVMSTLEKMVLEKKKDNIEDNDELVNFIQEYNTEIKNKYTQNINVEIFKNEITLYYGCILINWINIIDYYDDFMFGYNINKKNLINEIFNDDYEMLVQQGVLESFSQALDKINSEIDDIFVFVDVRSTKDIVCEIVDEIKPDSLKFKFNIKSKTIKIKEKLYSEDVRFEKSIKTYDGFDYYNFLKDCVAETFKSRGRVYCDCNKPIFKNNKEVWFFMNKGFATPKLCYDCRQKRKLKGGQ